MEVSSMKTLISVIIPVYKEPKTLPHLLRKIMHDPYPHKEIIVIIDEPSNETLKIIGEYHEKIKVIINEERKGKVYALNKALKISKGELLLFLDNDVLIEDDNFLEKIVKEMKNTDIGEIKKEIVRDSFISRMVYFDYISFNFGSYMFSNKLGKCLALNGAAVAIWRNSLLKLGGFRRRVSEDLDLGTRSYMLGLKFKFIDSTKVLNEAPSDIKEWFKQRDRWTKGTGLWLKEHWRYLVRVLRQEHRIVTLTLITLYPSLLITIISLLVYNTHVGNFLVLLLLGMLSRFRLYSLSIMIPSQVIYSILRNAIINILGLALFCIYFIYASKKLNLKFNVLEFMIYYLLYSPIWLFITLTNVIKVLLLGDIKIKDWKI
ncbi:MAG TPA: glycosyltransferase family 2 protein [Thermofilum sp.]|nr:glycosyltransferase family 2 protein [Thermofilum sp.]